MAEVLTLIILSLSLSVDTFAAALTKGATFKKLKPPEKHRIATIFTACAVIAPALGYFVGYMLSNIITEVDHWIAFILLSATGAHMAYNGFKPAEQNTDRDLSTTHILVTAVATNIDAVAVGIGLAFTTINILHVSLAIALATVAAIYAGLHLGRKTGDLLGHRAEILGGLVLIAIGFKILIQHLTA